MTQAKRRDNMRCHVYKKFLPYLLFTLCTNTNLLNKQTTDPSSHTAEIAHTHTQTHMILAPDTYTAVTDYGVTCTRDLITFSRALNQTQWHRTNKSFAWTFNKKNILWGLKGWVYGHGKAEEHQSVNKHWGQFSCWTRLLWFCCCCCCVTFFMGKANHFPT